ncbi:unnamed protein product, partial [Scytosiphon promiscuus]
PKPAGEGLANRAAKPAGAAGASMAKRARPQRPAAGARGAAAKGGNNQQGIMRFYTDDAPGLRIGPTVVLVFSLAFIGCVVLLHIWGKFKG